ncbi:hypothetical protein SRHO_G00216800 [Serrasalmus rhombeus]
MSRKSVKYLTEKEMQELLFRENSDEDVDHVEAEVMYDSDSDKDYIPEPSDDDDEDDSDGAEPSTSSHKRKKIQHHDCGSPTTRQMATPGPVASTSTAHPTFLAATQAIPATPNAGRRGRRRRHEYKDVGVSFVVRFENSSYRSTSGFQWSCQPQTSATTRTAARNVMPAFTPGPTPEASNADTPEKSFTLFVEDQIIDEIVTWTNIHIVAVAAKYLKRTATIGSTHKPEVIEFYNQTKGGVDTLDQMCAHYSCSRKTKRWPLCVLYGMMNAGVINSWIILKENALRRGDTPMRMHVRHKLSVMQEDCAFTRQASHVPGIGGPKTKFPAALFFLLGHYLLRIT